MKIYLLTIIFGGLLFCLSSCCGKGPACSNGDKINMVNLEGFDLFGDSVIFNSFERGSNFNQKTSDSFTVRAHRGVVSLPKFLDINKDWIISVGAVKQFKFSEATPKKEVCHGCIFSQTSYFTLLEYKLNGETKRSDVGQLVLIK